MTNNQPPRARRARRPRENAPTTPDAVEIAMEAEATGYTPAGGAAEVLRRHALLLGWQAASERATFALKVLTGVVGLGVAVVLVVLIWSSSRYQGLVVQAFSTPPDLVARGLTGEVFAGDLMDRLVRMQEQTNSVRAPSSYAIDWSDGTEVEIPQTGVSIGELRRYLRSWLGKETRISGVVYRQQDGQLAVTARTGGSASATFIGPESDLEGLMTKAAESVYARTQPYRYTVYLLDHGRDAEAEPIWQAAESYGEPESLWLVRGWGLEKARHDDYRGALEKFRWVEARSPGMGPLYQTLGDAESALGHAEAAYQARLRAARLIARSREVDPEIRTAYAASQRASAFLYLYDLKAVEIATAASAGMGSDAQTLRFLRWDLAAVAEDLVRPGASPEALLMKASESIFLALAKEDFNEALKSLDALPGLSVGNKLLIITPATHGPLRIDALIGTGRRAEALALATTLPSDCYPCVIAQANVAEAVGDRAAADAAFAKAEILGPSLPDASQQWGRALLKRGDTTGAIRHFEEARRRAPHWADTYKYWGDALLASGDASGALRKYEKASETVPLWGALSVAQGQALDRLGRRMEATDRFRQARGLVLTTSDRGAVERRLKAPV